MGGIIIFTAISVPFLILSDYDWRSVGRLRGGDRRARCSASPTTTRRSSGAARWACAARTKLLVTVAISLGLWWVATKTRGLAGTLRLRVVDAHDRPRRRSTRVLIYLVVAGHDERGEPHRRPRRPGRGLRGDRAARLHRRSRSSRPASTTWRCCAAAWSARASASCGSTRSRRRSSWATPARSGSAARSPGWR